MKKKLISTLLTLAMIVSLFPGVVMGAETYTVTVVKGGELTAVNATGDTVSGTIAEVASGTTVTLTADGWDVNSAVEWAVTDENGDVEVFDNLDGTATFTMPASDVTAVITVTALVEVDTSQSNDTITVAEVTDITITAEDETNGYVSISAYQNQDAYGPTETVEEVVIVLEDAVVGAIITAGVDVAISTDTGTVEVPAAVFAQAANAGDKAITISINVLDEAPDEAAAEGTDFAANLAVNGYHKFIDFSMLHDGDEMFTGDLFGEETGIYVWYNAPYAPNDPAKEILVNHYTDKGTLVGPAAYVDYVDERLWFALGSFSFVAIAEVEEVVAEYPVANGGTVEVNSIYVASGDTVVIQVENYSYKETDDLTWTVTFVDDEGNTIEIDYETSNADGTVTFTMPNYYYPLSVTVNVKKNTTTTSGGGGGGSSTLFDIDVNDPENGTVSIKPSSQRASSGTYVTITVDPDDGYVVDEVTVVRSSNDDEIDVDEVTKNAKYTFTMPGGDVDVTVTFIEEEEAKAKEEVKEEPKEEEEEEPADEERVFNFIDVQPTDWYYTAVYAIYQAGLMNGTSDLTFEPNTVMTRAMVAQILYNLSGAPDVYTSAGFADVYAGEWYADAVNWAAANSYVSGYGNGSYGPNDPVTREQLVTILYRYAKSVGLDTSAAASLGTYSDAVQVSSYALEAMSWAVGDGVISGTTPTTLDPQGQATRAQVASMLMRFLLLVEA